MNNYVELAIRTEAPITPEVISRLCKQARFVHAVLGKLTEVGEFADQLKKHIFYGKELDLINLMEEVGDGFWYDAVAINEINEQAEDDFSFSEVQERNIDKLQKRYPNKFAEAEALNRDLDAERQELEKAITEESRRRLRGVANVQAMAGPQGIQEETPHKQTPNPEIMKQWEDKYEGSAVAGLPRWRTHQRDIHDKAIITSNSDDENLPTGKYVLLRLDDPDEKFAHRVRQNLKQLAKDVWHEDEERRRWSEYLKAQISAVEEALPPLRG